MDSTKNFFDAWMNTQTKFVDNLMDTSKKIQESLNNGEVIEKSVELYNKWFDNQKSLTDAMMTAVKEQNGQQKTPDFFKNWMESQMELGKKWMEYLNYAASKNTRDKGLEVYIDNMQGLYEDWNRIYNQMFSQINPSSQRLEFPLGFGNQSFSSFINNTHTYMKMFELWQPIYKMMQSNTMGLDSLSKILDMDRYKEVLDNIFHFMEPEKSRSFLEMIQKYNEVFVGYTNTKSLDQFQQLMPGNFMDSNITTLAQMAQQFSEQFNKFINPYFTMMPAGREKEMFRIMISIQDKYTRYYMRALEMQNMIYVAGQKSIEKAVKEIMQKAQEKASLITFDEFYTSWVNTIEEEIITLFGSDAYSRLQGEPAETGSGNQRGSGQTNGAYAIFYSGSAPVGNG
ncbi:MAG: hypothetical protein HC880_15650 [Bacteroidia bacterium]|nr:hypothetical protein [Bacteroidia bacterium]